MYSVGFCYTTLSEHRLLMVNHINEYDRMRKKMTNFVADMMFLMSFRSYVQEELGKQHRFVIFQITSIECKTQLFRSTNDKYF